VVIDNKIERLSFVVLAMVLIFSLHTTNQLFKATHNYTHLIEFSLQFGDVLLAVGRLRLQEDGLLRGLAGLLDDLPLLPLTLLLLVYQLPWQQGG